MNSYPQQIFKNILSSRKLLIELTKSDLQKTYVQSSLGFLWVILDPLIMLGLLFIVFSSGFRGGSNPPEIFIPNVFAGLITYYFFTDAIRQGSRSVSTYRYLVKKVNFKIEILPMVKVLSAFCIHIVFLFLFTCILLIFKKWPNLFWLQLVYYIAVQLLFLFSITTLLSSIEPFFKDINKIVPIVTRLLFWLTPIFWNIERVPKDLQFLVKLNPLCYIVEGYRNSMVSNTYLWNNPMYDLYFLGLCIFILILGLSAQSKLRPFFAENL